MARRRLHLLAAISAAAGLILAASTVTAKVEATTTGSGTILVLGTITGTFSYEALAADDGSAKGAFHFDLVLQGQVVDFDGAVTCVTFDAENHRAWIGGVVTANRSAHPQFTTARTQVGEDIWFRVVDNGEGQAAPDDRTTFVGFAGDRGIATSSEYCAAQPWVEGDVSTWPVVEGNLQVRP